MAENEVLSSTALANMRNEMKKRGINWLIDLFIKELPNYFENLRQAAAHHDSQKLYEAAHKFKGSCTNLGAIRMVALCQQLELLAHAGNLEQANLLLGDNLDNEGELLRQALEAEKLRGK